MSINSLQRSTPEAEGVLSTGIHTFLDDLEKHKISIHSMMLIRNGKVISEVWWPPFSKNNKRYMYSLSKSFTSTAIGFVVTEGLLSVEDKIISFFPEDVPEQISENLAAMRVKDLLTMTTGHATDTVMNLLAPGLDNWSQVLLSLPVDFPPGTHFIYNSGASYLLSVIVQKVTGKTTVEYLNEHLFTPLGITEYKWDSCPLGYTTGGWGLCLKTEDIAKFGLFYAHKGDWQGKQLLPKSWIEEATAACVPNGEGDRIDEPVDWRQGYGYQIWRSQHNTYRADGAFGQYCLVIPEENAVLVITSEVQNMQTILDLVWQHLLPAMKEDPIHGQKKEQEQLHQRLTNIQANAQRPFTNSPLAAKISMKHFIMDENPFGIQHISFAFEDDKTRFTLVDRAGEHQILCGNGTWMPNQSAMPFMYPSMMEIAFGKNVPPDVPTAGICTWKEDHIFRMIWQYLETPHHESIVCEFSDNNIHIDLLNSFVDPSDPQYADLPTTLNGKLA